jgi:hypothetical protein
MYFQAFYKNSELPPLFVMEADTGGLAEFSVSISSNNHITETKPDWSQMVILDAATNSYKQSHIFKW